MYRCIAPEKNEMTEILLRMTNMWKAYHQFIQVTQYSYVNQDKWAGQLECALR